MLAFGNLVPAILLGIALAMDAFAVALTQGARYRPAPSQAFAIAATFGIFQGIMPLIGWRIGAVALTYVEAVDHWIAFALLAYLGGRMIFAGEDDEEPGRKLIGWPLLVAGVATSIDALAAGLTLPTMALDPVLTCAVVAIVTFAFSAVGVALGAKAGDRFGRPAEILGGVILIALGLRILGEHTGFL